MTATPKQAMTVRKAHGADLEALLELQRDLGYPTARSVLVTRLDRIAGERSVHVFVAELDDRVVGLASLHILHLIERPPLARLSAIVVAASRRRGGAGVALVRRVEQEAREAGCDRLEVTSGEWREDAHGFYRALGFEETSKRFIKPLTEPRQR